MAPTDRRIGPSLGGLTRGLNGADQQDLDELERRRAEHERRTAPKPQRAFSELLGDEQRGDAQQEEGGPADEDDAQAPGDTAKSTDDRPRRPPLPQGRHRLIRG